MDADTWILLGAVAVLGSNYLVRLGDEWHRRRAFFWLIQLLNLLGACYMAGWGIPGFREGPTKIMNFVFSALFAMHVLQNNRRLQRAVAEARRGADPLEEKRAAVLEKLKGDP